jgi:CheB methylesterase
MSDLVTPLSISKKILRKYLSPREGYGQNPLTAAETPNVRVIGIGASAGGIEALREFFDATPTDTGLAFAVVQHLDPSQPSHMAGLLSRYTEMEVSEVEDGTAVQANHVYTIPSNTFLFIKDGKLRLTEIVKRDGLRTPIDFFFRSLAENQRENAIAVDNQACHPPDLSYPRGSVRAAPGKQDGYLEPKRKADMTRAGVKEFVNKPYRLDDVVSTIQNVIERK